MQEPSQYIDCIKFDKIGLKNLTNKDVLHWQNNLEHVTKRVESVEEELMKMI